MRFLKISAVFVDLFALLVCFLFVQWYLAILLTNPAQENKPTSKPRAEMLVTDSWKEVAEDIDIWIRRVDNEVVGYRNREEGPFKLHGDHTSEHYGMVDGVSLEEAVEVITIHKKIPGRYQVSIHGYRIRPPLDAVEITFELENVDPFKRFCKIKRKVTNGEEVPVCEFIINSEGEVSRVIVDPILLSKFLHLSFEQGEE